MSKKFTMPRLKELLLSLPLPIKLTRFYDVSADFILGLTDVREHPPLRPKSTEHKNPASNGSGVRFNQTDQVS